MLQMKIERVESLASGMVSHGGLHLDAHSTNQVLTSGRAAGTSTGPLLQACGSQNLLEVQSESAARQFCGDSESSSAGATRNSPYRKIVVTSDARSSLDPRIVRNAVSSFVKDKVNSLVREDCIVRLHWNGCDISTLYLRGIEPLTSHQSAVFRGMVSAGIQNPSGAASGQAPGLLSHHLGPVLPSPLPHVPQSIVASAVPHVLPTSTSGSASPYHALGQAIAASSPHNPSLFPPSQQTQLSSTAVAPSTGSATTSMVSAVSARVMRPQRAVFTLGPRLCSSTSRAQTTTLTRATIINGNVLYHSSPEASSDKGNALPPGVSVQIRRSSVPLAPPTVIRTPGGGPRLINIPMIPMQLQLRSPGATAMLPSVRVAPAPVVQPSTNGPSVVNSQSCAAVSSIPVTSTMPRVQQPGQLGQTSVSLTTACSMTDSAATLPIATTACLSNECCIPLSNTRPAKPTSASEINGNATCSMIDGTPVVSPVGEIRAVGPSTTYESSKRVKSLQRRIFPKNLCNADPVNAENSISKTIGTGVASNVGILKTQKHISVATNKSSSGPSVAKAVEGIASLPISTAAPTSLATKIGTSEATTQCLLPSLNGQAVHLESTMPPVRIETPSVTLAATSSNSTAAESSSTIASKCVNSHSGFNDTSTLIHFTNSPIATNVNASIEFPVPAGRAALVRQPTSPYHKPISRLSSMATSSSTVMVRFNGKIQPARPGQLIRRTNGRIVRVMPDGALEEVHLAPVNAVVPAAGSIYATYKPPVSTTSIESSRDRPISLDSDSGDEGATGEQTGGDRNQSVTAANEASTKRRHDALNLQSQSCRRSLSLAANSASSTGGNAFPGSENYSQNRCSTQYSKLSSKEVASVRTRSLPIGGRNCFPNHVANSKRVADVTAIVSSNRPVTRSASTISSVQTAKGISSSDGLISNNSPAVSQIVTPLAGSTSSSRVGERVSRRGPLPPLVEQRLAAVLRQAAIRSRMRQVATAPAAGSLSQASSSFTKMRLDDASGARRAPVAISVPEVADPQILIPEINMSIGEPFTSAAVDDMVRKGNEFCLQYAPSGDAPLTIRPAGDVDFMQTVIIDQSGEVTLDAELYQSFMEIVYTELLADHEHFEKELRRKQLARESPLLARSSSDTENNYGLVPSSNSRMVTKPCELDIGVSSSCASLMGVDVNDVAASSLQSGSCIMRHSSSNILKPHSTEASAREACSSLNAKTMRYRPVTTFEVIANSEHSYSALPVSNTNAPVKQNSASAANVNGDLTAALKCARPVSSCSSDADPLHEMTCVSGAKPARKITSSKFAQTRKCFVIMDKLSEARLQTFRISSDLSDGIAVSTNSKYLEKESSLAEGQSLSGMCRRSSRHSRICRDVTTLFLADKADLYFDYEKGCVDAQKKQGFGWNCTLQPVNDPQRGYRHPVRMLSVWPIFTALKKTSSRNDEEQFDDYEMITSQCDLLSTKRQDLKKESSHKFCDNDKRFSNKDSSSGKLSLLSSATSSPSKVTTRGKALNVAVTTSDDEYTDTTALRSKRHLCDREDRSWEASSSDTEDIDFDSQDDPSRIARFRRRRRKRKYLSPEFCKKFLSLRRPKGEEF